MKLKNVWINGDCLTELKKHTNWLRSKYGKDL